MQWLVIIVGLVLAVWFVQRWSKNLEGSAKKRALWWLVAPLGVLLLVLGVRMGAAWLPLLAAGGLAVLKKLFPLLLRLAPLAWVKWQGARSKEREVGTGDGNGEAKAVRGNMTRAEALEVLGLSEGASHAEVTETYRRLIQRVHPDKPGGSHYLAAKLNQAKSVLLS